MRRLFTFFVLFFSFLWSPIKAQEEVVSDTIIVSETSTHSPAKASILSTAIPGAGQIYNKKYWKVPLVYAAIGTPLFLAIDQSRQFEEFKSAYLSRVDDDPNTNDLKYDGVYSDADLINLIDFHRRNRDLFYVLTGFAYVLNIVDATVDAHLYSFDVSDDISGNIRPGVQFITPQQLTPIPSLKLTLKFGKKSSRPF